MHRLLIENYIKQINKTDIYNFAIKNNIQLTQKDVDILYHYLKNNWQEILYGNSRGVFSELKTKFEADKFIMIKELFDFYFEKYHDFL